MAIRTDSFFDDEDEGEGGGDERGEGEEEEEADEAKGEEEEEEEEEAMGFLSFRKALEAEEAVDVVEGEVRTWWQTMIWEWVDTSVLGLMNR